MEKKRILFLANHFITLFSFRKEMINRMVEEGHELYLSLPESEENEYFEKLGCKIVPTMIDRRGVNPVKDLKLIRQYKKIIKEVHPDIIFSYTIKPNIYGTMASNGTGKKQVCNITGTGATFLKRSVVSTICEMLYRMSVKKCYKVFFQNTGDRDYFLEHGMVRQDNYAMLPGSGCNLMQHAFKPLPEGEQINFIYIGRVMKLKGIDEYLACAEMTRKKYPQTKFYIAGWNEEEEYMHKVEEAQKAGWVEYIGFRKDIDQWIEKCHCTILASYGGEGVPNVLLESAATGRVCIASKINGSKDVVDHGVTGYLFEKGNAEDLAAQVEKFILLNPEEKAQMGKAGREKVEREFDREIVVKAYLEEVYSC
ncbi:MAG: glycosyltransferase family 4 protein [Bacteroidaceae bacterium]|nr:glycosyltransferase family 4 protein [Bacteroidaceae bacterium]